MGELRGGEGGETATLDRKGHSIWKRHKYRAFVLLYKHAHRHNRLIISGVAMSSFFPFFFHKSQINFKMFKFCT